MKNDNKSSLYLKKFTARQESSKTRSIGFCPRLDRAQLTSTLSINPFKKIISIARSAPMTNAVGQTNRENKKKGTQEQRWSISNPTRVSPCLFSFSFSLPYLPCALLMRSSFRIQQVVRCLVAVHGVPHIMPT